MESCEWHKNKLTKIKTDDVIPYLVEIVFEFGAAEWYTYTRLKPKMVDLL